jgi:micrococcal nuclease
MNSYSLRSGVFFYKDHMLINNKRAKIILSTLFIVLFGGYFGFSEAISNNPHASDKSLARSAEEFQVIRVVDGDTIVVAINQKPETIRLLGINTPETVAPNRPVQCFGPEASARTKELLETKIIRLESDPSQDDRDKYKRLLRFAFLEDENINETLVRDGYAKEYTYKTPHKYQQEFRAVQRSAKKNGLGLWGACP